MTSYTSLDPSTFASPAEQSLVHPQESRFELPSHGRATSIQLKLRDHGLQLLKAAAAARYEALTDLVLDAAWYVEGDDRLDLGEFLSSCCPRLRRLHIDRHPRLRPPPIITQQHQAPLAEQVGAPPPRGGAGGAFHLLRAKHAWALDMMAPNLCVLKIESHMPRPSSSKPRHRSHVSEDQSAEATGD